MRQFQLTHLSRGATGVMMIVLCSWSISTHAPLARCDSMHRTIFTRSTDFNSRTSREVRRACALEEALGDEISTHAPLARCDGTIPWRSQRRWKFQLTHLSRGATAFQIPGDLSLTISTHAPLARCDRIYDAVRSVPPISTHAPLARCDKCGTISMHRD